MSNVLLINGEARRIPLADGSVHCIVTSPPYYSLRDYGTAEWRGGDPECPHTYQKGGRNPETSAKQVTSAGTQFSQYEHTCKKCGAHRVDHQLGLEDTPEAYIANMVEVFRECYRVLRDDGTLWLNIGDSYAGSGGAGGDYAEGGLKEGQPTYEGTARKIRGKNSINREASDNGKRTHKGPLAINAGYKPKDLIGIPWMVAFALRADGWYLRQDLIWHKPNPMPESVTDRCTKAHEYIFLLSKSARYFYDAEAILEPVSPNTHMRVSQNVAEQIGSFRANGGAKTNGPMKAVIRTPKQRPAGEGIKNNDSFNNAVVLSVEARNKRSVWTIATAPYSGAHFATFPPALVEPCIKAGCPEGGIVFDPFAGSGTSLMVARSLGRHAVGLDLSLKYLRECARTRLELTAWDEWQNGIQVDTSTLSDLPLFGGME